MRFLIPLLFGLGCAGSTPLAKFEIHGEEVDASCTRLTDFCMRVSCSLKNTGPVPGQAVVEMQLVDKSGKVLYSETKREELGPGDSRSLTNDFTQVKLGTEANGRCVVR